MSKKRKKTVAQLEKEVDDLKLTLAILRSGKKWEAILSLGRPAITWIGACVLGYFALGAIQALAGVETSADIAIQVLANIDISVYIAWGGSLAFFLLMLRERRLRKKLIKRYHPEQVEAELKIDENRSSSGLTHDGETNPEDEI